MKKSLSAFHLNIASLELHFDELHTLLTSCNINFDFVGISETGFQLNSNIHDIEGYSYTDCHTESTKGGVRLYIANKYTYKSRPDLNIYESKNLESVFVEIYADKRKSNMIIGCVYKHPEMSITDFNSYFSKSLEKMSLENKKIIIFGDFNIDLMKSDIHNDTASFLDIMTSNSLSPLILRPTRFTPHSKTLIDNIFTNFIDTPVTSGNLTCTISDHLAQSSILDFSINNLKKQPKKHIRNFKNFNKNDFLLDILAIDWEKELILSDPNKNLHTIVSLINCTLDDHVPMIKISAKKDFVKKPWITKGILNSINYKNKLYRKFLLEKNQTKKSQLFTDFKIYRNFLTKISRVSKTLHYKIFLVQHRSNLKKAWKGIKSLINCKGKQFGCPTSIMYNGNLTNDPFLIANCFNQHFSTVAEKTKKKIHPSQNSFSDFLGLPNNNSLFLYPTNAAEVGKIILSLNENKAHGPGSIPTNILKLIAPTFSNLLSKIINTCLSAGIFPDCIKHANVTPVYKKGSALDPVNYRPISLLSNINKIFEKIIHIRLSSFLEKYSCLYNSQFGFRKGYGTSHALLYLTESIRSAIDNGKYACGVFVDLEKAFDTVDHQILLRKLNHYGVRVLPILCLNLT